MVHSKRRIGVAISIFTVSLICLLTLTMAHAPPPSPGYLEWYNPNTFTWEGISPSPNHLDLLPEDLPIQFRINGLPSSLMGSTIQIKVSNEDWFISSSRVQVISGSVTDPFTWPDPDHPFDYEICVTNVVQYRELEQNAVGYHNGKVHVVDGIIGSNIGKPAHVHIIPEFVFGTAMAVLSLFSGLGIYSKYRKI